MAKPYTNREVEKIRVGRKAGLPLAEIVKDMPGRTVAGLQRYCGKHGINVAEDWRFRTTREQRKDAIRLVKAGMSRTDVAKIIGVTRRALQKIPGMPKKFERGAGRKNTTVPFNLPIEHVWKIDEVARRKKITRTETIRLAVVRFLRSEGFDMLD